jgi:hypothetical protein
MADVTGLDKKGTLEALYFAIASEMYSSLDHIFKYISSHIITLRPKLENCIIYVIKLQ